MTWQTLEQQRKYRDPMLRNRKKTNPWDTQEFMKWWEGGGQKSYMDQQAGTFSGMGYGGGTVGDQQAAGRPMAFADNPTMKWRVPDRMGLPLSGRPMAGAPNPIMPVGDQPGGGGGNEQYTGSWGDKIRAMDADPTMKISWGGQERTREDLVAQALAQPGATSRVTPGATSRVTGRKTTKRNRRRIKNPDGSYGGWGEWKEGAYGPIEAGQTRGKPRPATAAEIKSFQGGR